jgi:hypothetical protein
VTADRLHEGETVTVADPPELEKDTVPVGENPVTVAVHTLDEPTITVVGAHATAIVLRTGFTASVNGVVVAMTPFESVTVRVTMNGVPVVAVGVQEIEGKLDVEHPSGRFVQA